MCKIGDFMNARMEKYTSDSTATRRTKKNERLYSEVGNMNIDFVDIDVDNALELNPTKSGKTSREDFQKQRELRKILPNREEKSYDETQYVEPKEDRVYDINEILKMARENKLFEDQEKKRLINTEYNILTKLDVDSLESDEMKKEDLRSLINDIYQKESPKKPKKVKTHFRSEEERLLSDLFEEEPEKKVSDNSIELQEDLSKAILNKELIDEKKVESEEAIATQIIPEAEPKTEPKENTTTMYDFGIEKKSKKDKKKKKEEKHLNEIEDESDYEEEREGKGLIVAIVIVVLLILATCGFFVYEYFFGI